VRTPEAVLSLVEAMRARGVTVPDTSPPDVETAHRPWFLSALLGLAGWVAGILILAFVAMQLELKPNALTFGLGLALVAGAWVMYFADRNAVFLDQLALALSIAGQLCMAWALIDKLESEAAMAWVLLAMQLVMLALMPNRTARTLAALFAAIAWVYAVRLTVQDARAAAVLFDYGQRIREADAGRLFLCWALTFAPLLALTVWLARCEHQWMATPLRAIARPALTGLLLALAMSGIAGEPVGMRHDDNSALGVALAWWAVFPLLSIALAMFAAYAAFRLHSLGLLGFAIFAALVHLSRFYYNFGTSLTLKAVIMTCTGAVLLASGLWLRSRGDAVGEAP